MKRLLHFFRRNQKGQSMVEAAVVLPILVILLAGVIEVSNLAIVQNKMNTAARAGARFGANGGEDVGILQSHIWAITNTISIDESIWDIWVLRGQVDELRQIPADQFTFTHVYGLGKTQEFTATNTITFTNNLRQKIQNDLLLDVDNDPSADSSGVRFVGVYSLHDVQTILGLDVLPNLVGLETMSSFSVMRMAAVTAAVNQTSGCRGVFPLAIEQGVRTLTEAEFIANLNGQFTYPTGANQPQWNEFVRQPPAGTTVSLLDGIEGMVYRLNYGAFTSQRFDWLKWNQYITGLSSGNILATSLTWPGNSDDYINHNDLPATPPDDGWGFTYRGFAEDGDATDKQLHTGDFIDQDTVSTGFSGFGVEAALQDHISPDINSEPRSLRMILWDYSSGGGDPIQTRYKASGFGIFKILGYRTNSWILLQLVRIDGSCGQTVS